LKATVRKVEISPLDRILTLNLDKQDRVGSRYPSRLILESMARDSNAILIDPSDKIQGLLRAESTKHRKLHPGAAYQAPRPQHRKRPVDVTAEEFRQTLSEADTPVEALMTLCAGVDLRWAEELHLRAEMAGTDILSMTQTLSNKPPFDELPGCFLSPVGRYLTPVPYTPKGLDETKFKPVDTISQAIELVYQDSLKGQDKRGKKKGLAKTLKGAIKTASTKRDRINQDLETARKANDLEKMGSLILSQPQSIQQGVSSVEVNNLFDDKSSTITIPLSPDLSPTENGQAFLKRAAKLKKSAPILERRLLQTEDTVKKLESLRNELETLVEEEAIDAFQFKLVKRGLVRPRQARSKAKKIDSSGLHPRKYRTSDGWEVWVGRNDQENDRLTKSAPRHALWFHAHGCSGSHVVLRPRDKRDPSPEALHDAASLAAYWSKARGSKTVPVNYTEARHVQKPSGASAGLVTIRKEKTLFVQPREIEKWNTTQ